MLSTDLVHTIYVLLLYCIPANTSWWNTNWNHFTFATKVQDMFQASMTDTFVPDSHKTHFRTINECLKHFLTNTTLAGQPYLYNFFFIVPDFSSCFTANSFFSHCSDTVTNMLWKKNMHCLAQSLFAKFHKYMYYYILVKRCRGPIFALLSLG